MEVRWTRRTNKTRETDWISFISLSRCFFSQTNQFHNLIIGQQIQLIFNSFQSSGLSQDQTVTKEGREVTLIKHQRCARSVWSPRKEQRVLVCMAFPLQSPDLTSTEQLWENLKKGNIKGHSLRCSERVLEECSVSNAAQTSRIDGRQNTDTCQT